MRDLPAGVGYRNYFPVDIRARSTCSQSAVERVIKATSVEFSGFKNCNGKLRTGIRLVARTIAGAPISEACLCASLLILIGATAHMAQRVGSLRRSARHSPRIVSPHCEAE
jgi:hypothetical protein